VRGPLKINYAEGSFESPELDDLIRRRVKSLTDVSVDIFGCYVSVEPPQRPGPCRVRIRVEVWFGAGRRAVAAAEASGTAPFESGREAVESAFSALEQQVERLAG
jgi:hypothetical protein